MLLLRVEPGESALSDIEGFSFHRVDSLKQLTEAAEAGELDGIVVEGAGDPRELAERLRALSEDGMPIVLAGDPTEPGLLRMLPRLGMDAFLDVRWPPEFIASSLAAAIERVQLGRNMVAIQRNVMGALEEAQAELIRAREEALESARTKARFLATMTHEIRTPLNGVLGMTLLALDGQLSDEQRECLEIAHASARGLMDILNDILDISKIDSGRLALEETSFDLQRVVTEALVPLAVSAADKGVLLTANVHDGVPRRVIGDSTRLKQVLLNLTGNAVKFSGKGRVTVTIERDPDRRDAHLRFTIEDQGVGIAPSALEHIFEPFAQADGSMTRRFGGTGLGLAICKELIQLMDGDLSVESTLGKGSRFKFTAKLATDPVTGDILETSFPEASVLVVDCEQAVTARVLGARGAVVTTVPDPVSGRAHLEAHHGYDLVVVHLRGSGLFSPPEALRALVEQADGAVVAISAGLTSFGFDMKFPGVSVLPGIPFPEDLVSLLDRAQGRAPKPTVRERQYRGLDDLATTRSLRVLVAEDNPVNQMVIERLLRRMGHEVTMVASGVAAVEAAENLEFDVLLMDIQMPELDGAAAAEIIRQREFAEGSARRLPIYALTANAAFVGADVGDHALMDGILTKPVDPELLAATLDAVA